MTGTWQNEVGNIKVNDRGMRVAQRDGQEELLLEGQVSTASQRRSWERWRLYICVCVVFLVPFRLCFAYLFTAAGV